MDKRRGWYGFDGFGVDQEIVESTDDNTSNTTPSTQSTI